MNRGPDAGRAPVNAGFGDRPMRVLVVGPFPRSEARIDGGVAAATLYLSRAIAANPRVELIGVRLGGRGGAGQSSADFGWPVIDFPLGRFSVSTLFRRQIRRFGSLLREVRPDVVHAQGADLSGLLAVKSGVPAVVTIHGILSECAKLRTNPVARLRELAQARITERFVVERAPHVIAISPYVARHYQGRLGGVVHEVPNAVSPSFFSVRRNPQRGRLLFAGRLSKGKGVEDLVRVVAGAADLPLHLVLAGSSPDAGFEARLRDLVARSRHPERVELAGLLDEERLLEEFSRASALVLPSYQETAPMVIQQAMAAGLPVVATRVGGIPDMLEHDVTGLLFDPGDLVALERLIGRLDSEPALPGRLASAALSSARKLFVADAVGAATISVYEAALRPSST